jgi:hypothetical protein
LHRELIQKIDSVDKRLSQRIDRLDRKITMQIDGIVAHLDGIEIENFPNRVKVLEDLVLQKR